MTFETITYGVQDHIATVTLNRPHVLNAINRQLSQELGQTLDDAELDDDVRVVVMRGEGRAFSAGADLKERANDSNLEADPEQVIARFRHGFAYMKIWDLSKPVIASVHGYCLAGACEMVGLCDITIASDDAIFGEPEVKFVNPIMLPISAILLGLKKGKEFLYTGDFINAQDAERLGMVNKVVPRDQLEAETMAMATKLAAIPPPALRLNKRNINKIWELMGLRIAVNTNQEVLAYLFALQSKGGADAGFRDSVREVGLRAALDQLPEPRG